MKGIILAGGSGTRLYPLTLVVSKQLLPVYDKPMIYYPLSVLMLAGIKEILIISTPNELPDFRNLLGDGTKLGINISYEEQPSPEGIAQAFIIGESFIDNDSVALILGDNIFYGNNLTNLLNKAKSNQVGASIFGYYHEYPEKFGVFEFDTDGKVIGIEEKPSKAKSNYISTGLYFYDNHVVKYAKELKPSDRGELEITDLNNIYLEKGNLDVILLGRGFAWLDTGSVDSLVEASDFIRIIEKRQGIKIAALEEIAYRKGWINKDSLLKSAKKYGNSGYGAHLIKVAEGKVIY